MFRPEILAPAGNLFKLKTALRYGADAVYIAGRKFGLRSAADNFTLPEIIAGCRFAHERGAKVYATLNGFLFDEELAELPAFLLDLERADVDAVIVSDLGVLETVRERSGVPIHLSTQASALNSRAAGFWKDRGVTRIVLAREASIAEAAAIKRTAGVEVEMFIHGAMCTAFSGNCVISNYTAGRDSNRGGCVQSCRFNYTLSRERGGETGPEGRFLSSKDLQAARHLSSFIDAEIDSLKIEGRMKSPLYAANTARVYAAARDWALAGCPEPPPFDFERELNAMSHRGYTTGNLVGKADGGSIDRDGGEAVAPSHEWLGHVLEAGPNHIAALLKNPLHAGEPVELITRQGAVRLDSSRLRDLSGSSIDKAQPNQVALFAGHPLAEKDLLLRMQKRVETQRHAVLAG